MWWSTGNEFFRRQANPCARYGKFLRELRALHEGEIVRRSAIERSNAVDAPLGCDAGTRNSAGERDDLLRGQALGRLEEARLGHATCCGGCDQNFVPPLNRSCCTRSFGSFVSGKA